MIPPKMMMKPKPARPPPEMSPSSFCVKPYWLAQSTRMLPRTPKPTPAAKMEKKPAHRRRLALAGMTGPMCVCPVKCIAPILDE